MPSVRPNIAEMQGYTPGEQPQGVEKFIKLNTNENPYQCSPKVKAGIGRVVQAGLQKYPDPMATAFRIRAAELHGVEPDWILCGNGSDDILTIVTRAFVGTSDMVRFGYLVAHPQVIRELVKVKDSYNCDSVSIAGGTAAIDDQAWLAETRSVILATRERMTAALKELGFEVVDSQANFVWCTHSTS